MKYAPPVDDTREEHEYRFNGKCWCFECDDSWKREFFKEHTIDLASAAGDGWYFFNMFGIEGWNRAYRRAA